MFWFIFMCFVMIVMVLFGVMCRKVFGVKLLVGVVVVSVWWLRLV